MTNFVHNFESEDLQPYADGECRHPHRVDNKGVLTCTDCGATYNESTLEWEKEE